MAPPVLSVKVFKDPARLVTIILLAFSAAGWVMFVVGWGLFWHVRRFTTTASLSSGFYFPQWYYIAAGPILGATMLLRTCLMLPKYYGLIPAVVNMFLVLLTFILGGCMLTWNGILLAIFKLLTPDAPYLALRGLYVSIIGGIISIFFLALATCASIFIEATAQTGNHETDSNPLHLVSRPSAATDGDFKPLEMNEDCA
ncbi:hypothetical protein EMCRGX_G029374 [Ephydatia muelleri]